MRPLKIVVGGYAVSFPLGGQVWMLMHYLRGLMRLGHEVIFIEDTAEWALPFDPNTGAPSQNSRHGREVIGRAFDHIGLSGRWAYNSIFENRLYGMERQDLERFCSQADLFLNVSGVIPLRDIYLKAKVRAVIDTDPVFTQHKIAGDGWTRDYFRQHDLVFTYGCNIPSRVTGLPLSGIEYIPTVMPVVLDMWPILDTPGHGFTSIGTWDAKDRDIIIDGRKLSWRKCEKYERLIDLPGLLPGVTLDLTMSGMKPDEVKRFANHGWSVKDALVLSKDIWTYRDYIQNSTGEFSVAKEQNIKLKSGWFSDRSATYLASGRPVIVEDTGFGDYLPVGCGLVPFEGPDNAITAIETVLADYPKHRRAARRIAEDHFESAKVLTGILKHCGF